MKKSRKRLVETILYSTTGDGMREKYRYTTCLVCDKPYKNCIKYRNDTKI